MPKAVAGAGVAGVAPLMAPVAAGPPPTPVVEASKSVAFALAFINWLFTGPVEESCVLQRGATGWHLEAAGVARVLRHDCCIKDAATE